jgi:ABC-type nitrate/sulfonate/bicarbonate transport system ATPase subunit
VTHKLETIGLIKNYGDLCVLDGVDVHADQDEFVSLLGASGCGKSTILNILAGLVEPTEGEVLLEGESVSGPGPDRGLVFQSYSLYPWRTVRENVAFGLEIQKLPKDEVESRVDHFLEAMGLANFADALPRALSGGMKQRVAIARALATSPEVLLLDEPFGALDAQTRLIMQDFMLDTWRHPGTCNTILLVTHDVEEAVYLSGRIYLLSSSPAHVVEEIPVPFGRDRNEEILRDSRLHDLVAYIRGRLRVWASAAAHPTSPEAQQPPD